MSTTLQLFFVSEALLILINLQKLNSRPSFLLLDLELIRSRLCFVFLFSLFGPINICVFIFYFLAVPFTTRRILVRNQETDHALCTGEALRSQLHQIHRGSLQGVFILTNVAIDHKRAISELFFWTVVLGEDSGGVPWTAGGCETSQQLNNSNNYNEI